MGILEYLLAGLGPEARERLAKEAAKSAVKNVGDAIYERADELRERVERAAEERRGRRERAEAQRREREQRARDARAIEDELEALKRRVSEE